MAVAGGIEVWKNDASIVAGALQSKLLPRF